MVVKKMAFTNPEILHALLDKLTDSVTDYIRYQADCGAQASGIRKSRCRRGGSRRAPRRGNGLSAGGLSAQVVQIFDSWGCNLHPTDWDVFSGPYIKRIVDSVKARRAHSSPHRIWGRAETRRHPGGRRRRIPTCR